MCIHVHKVGSVDVQLVYLFSVLNTFNIQGRRMITQNARYKQSILEPLFVLMLLCDRRSMQEADPIEPDNVFVNGAFITLYGYASTGPKLERKTCRSMLQCGHFCPEKFNVCLLQLPIIRISRWNMRTQ